MNLLSESFLCGSFDSGPDMSRLGAAGLLSLGDLNPAACLEDTMFLQRQVGGGIFGCDAFLGILDGKGLCLGLCSESTMAFRTQNVPTTPLWIGPSHELWRISHDSWPILTNLTVVSNFQFIRARFVLVEAACSKQMPQLLEGTDLPDLPSSESSQVWCFQRWRDWHRGIQDAQLAQPGTVCNHLFPLRLCQSLIDPPWTPLQIGALKP